MGYPHAMAFVPGLQIAQSVRLISHQQRPPVNLVYLYNSISKNHLPVFFNVYFSNFEKAFFTGFSGFVGFLGFPDFFLFASVIVADRSTNESKKNSFISVKTECLSINSIPFMSQIWINTFHTLPYLYTFSVFKEEY